MRSEPSLPRRLAVSVVTLLAAAATVYAVIAKPWAPEGTLLTADFGEAGQGLSTASLVKVRGVRIGRVDAIGLLPDGRARLTLRIDEGVRVPASARASLEPESVFGPKFINLLPGADEAAGPYLADGGHIAATSGSGDLNDLFTDADRALAAIDPQDVAIIVTTLAEGLRGQGRRLRDVIDDADVIAGVAHRHRQDARRFLADLARLSEIRGMGDDLVTLTGSGNAVIGAAASGQGRLRGLASGVADMSGTLAGGLDRHGGQLSQGVRSAERAVGVIHAQLGVAGPAVRTLNEITSLYRAVSWVAAPHGRHMLAAKVMLPSDPCELLLGICPARGGR